MNQENSIIRDIVNWIDDNIHEPLKIIHVSNRAGYSPWHFQRMFLKHMNQSLAKYIRNRKLELAANDILISELSIVNISVKYGFDSPQSFTRSFIRKYNSPPGAFRKTKTLKYQKVK